MALLQTFFTTVAKTSCEGSQDDAKRAAAQVALDFVKDGMTLGLGTGSTVEFFLQGLAQRIQQEGLKVSGIPTSAATQRRAKELGIPLKGDPDYPVLASDFCVDGADRVDLLGRLVKGGGGALLREKLVATHSQRVCILVDPSKLIDVFDQSFAIPVECVPFGVESTISVLGGFGCQVKLRDKGGSPLVTDNGNVIADCCFQTIPEPVELEQQLLSVPGVVEVGIFSDLLDCLVVGFPDGSAESWMAPEEP